MNFRAGTEKQHKYIERMVGEGGYASVLAACAKHLGRPEEELAQNELSTSDARIVIEALQLETQRDGAGHAASDRKTDRKPERPHYTTAKELREFATGAKPVPQDIDEHAAWVLDRLRRLATVEQVIAGKQVQARAIPVGVNGNGPITMDHILTYHDQDWDRVAEAFRVAVPSAKAWGTNLPEARWYEAEVRTNGYVRVPRNAKGEVK